MIDDVVRWRHWELGNRYALEGSRIILWLNGLAAILAMSSHRVVFPFAIGVGFSVMVFVCAYLTGLYNGNGRPLVAALFGDLAYWSVLFSTTMFVIGVLAGG